MKRTDLIFTIILVPLDFLMLVIAALSAYYLRVGSFVTEIRPVIYALSFGEYLSYSFLLALAMLVIFAIAGLYAIQTGRKFSQEFAKIHNRSIKMGGVQTPPVCLNTRFNVLLP